MTIGKIMSKKVFTVHESTPYKKLWEAIVKKSINAVPVVDAKRRLVGIVTRDDLLTILYPDQKEFIDAFTSGAAYEVMEEKVHELGNIKAKNVMATRVIFTRDTTPIMRALSRMIARQVRQLPVLDEKDRVIGMVTKGDIFMALFKGQISGKNTKKSKK